MLTERENERECKFALIFIRHNWILVRAARIDEKLMKAKCTTLPALYPQTSLGILLEKVGKNPGESVDLVEGSSSRALKKKVKKLL